MATPSADIHGAHHHLDHEYHPQVAGFLKEFDRGLVPDTVEFKFEENAISGVQVNTDWSRLGLTFGLLCGLVIAAGITVWVPFLNVAWALAMVVVLLALPVFGARAALFRLRQGRAKVFRAEFQGDQVKWSSNDDWFWREVKNFLGI